MSRCCCPPLANRETTGNVTVAAYDLETGYLVWTNGYGRGFASGSDNVILAGINCTAGDNANGYQYTVAPNGIVSRIPGADAFEPIQPSLSGVKVDGQHYAIGPKTDTNKISIFEVHGTNGLQNEIVTTYANDTSVWASSGRIILFRNSLGGMIDVYSALDDTAFPSTDSLNFDVYCDESGKVAFSNLITHTFWTGDFSSGATDTGYTGSSAVHIDADGSLFVLTQTGGFPPVRTITKLPSPYTTPVTVSTGLTSTTTFRAYDDDHLMIFNNSVIQMYDNDLSLIWSTAGTFTGSFRSHPQLVKDGIFFIQLGPSSGGSAASRRMLAINIDTGSIEWDRTNVLMSNGSYSSGFYNRNTAGLMIDETNNRIICSHGNTGGFPIGGVISV